MSDIEREREAMHRLASAIGPTGMEDGNPGFDTLLGWCDRVTQEIYRLRKKVEESEDFDSWRLTYALLNTYRKALEEIVTHEKEISGRGYSYEDTLIVEVYVLKEIAKKALEGSK